MLLLAIPEDLDLPVILLPATMLPATMLPATMLQGCLSRPGHAQKSVQVPEVAMVLLCQGQPLLLMRCMRTYLLPQQTTSYTTVSCIPNHLVLIVAHRRVLKQQNMKQ